MKITITQLRRIIKEEIASLAKGKKSRLSEGHSRITEEEFNAWKSGDWGFVSESDMSGDMLDPQLVYDTYRDLLSNPDVKYVTLSMLANALGVKPESLRMNGSLLMIVREPVVVEM